jgi:DNA-binding MarR family transcriptional regulator
MAMSIEAARAAAQLGRTVNLALKRAELTPAGYRMLAYLVTGDTAAKILAKKLAISRPTVTATLDWLEPRGYVVRTPSTVDRRRVEISITGRGLDALAAADRLIVERLEAVFDDVDPAQVLLIVSCLEEIGVALNVYRVKGLPPDAPARDASGSA